MEEKDYKELKKQIESEVDSVWSIIAGGETFADKEKVKSIATKVFNGLGSKGNGITFLDVDFNKQYKKIDPMGLEKNTKATVIMLITDMMA